MEPASWILVTMKDSAIIFHELLLEEKDSASCRHKPNQLNLHWYTPQTKRSLWSAASPPSWSWSPSSPQCCHSASLGWIQRRRCWRKFRDRNWRWSNLLASKHIWEFSQVASQGTFTFTHRNFYTGQTSPYSSSTWSSSLATSRSSWWGC